MDSSIQFFFEEVLHIAYQLPWNDDNWYDVFVVSVVFGNSKFLNTISEPKIPSILLGEDKIWGTAGPTAALNAFLQLSPPGEFVAPWSEFDLWVRS